MAVAEETFASVFLGHFQLQHPVQFEAAIEAVIEAAFEVAFQVEGEAYVLEEAMEAVAVADFEILAFLQFAVATFEFDVAFVAAALGQVQDRQACPKYFPQ